MGDLRAISALTIDPNGRIFAFGIDETGTCSINYVRAGQPPRRLIFAESEIDRYTADLLISGPHLYFATEDGDIYRISDFVAAQFPTDDSAPLSTPVTTVTQQAYAASEITDPQNDIQAAHVDVVSFSYEIEGETLRAIIHLRDVPPELSFNRAGVPANRAEYQWSVYIDVDGDQQTGEQAIAIGADYSISILYFMHEDSSELVAPIQDLVQVNVWEFDPTTDGWNVIALATIEVDPEADTITLAGISWLDARVSDRFLHIRLPCRRGYVEHK
jgi:hypothetical protein